MKLALYLALSVTLICGFAAAQVTPPSGDLSNLDLEQLMQVTVQAASLHEQSLEDAPASVTIITQDEIRRYGYRTLAEALSSARGFYISTNRVYDSVGVRGYSVPGDYGTRILVMVNGHSMADNILGESGWFGQDFPLGMTLVKRIEIVRGPSSALYGSSGIFATINVVTLSPEEFGSTQVRTEVGSFGEKKFQAASSVSMAHGASLLLSGSIFNDSGEHSIFLPQYNSPATDYGRAVNVDGQKGYHFYGDFTWGDWHLTALFGGRSKIQPVGWAATVFNDRGIRSIDVRDFIDATYTHNFDSSRSLQWRISYDNYRFRGIYHYILNDNTADTEDHRDFEYGDGIGSQLSYRFPVAHIGSLTVGGAAKFDLRALMRASNIEPVDQTVLSIDKRDKSFAVFAQDELDLTRHWKLNLGARLDYSQYRHTFVSPRAALIYQPSTRTSYKLLYGRAFRNPSAFELFYDDGVTTTANPAARPEKANTFEFVVEHKLTRHVNGLVSAYRYVVNDLLVGDYTPSGTFQYRNENSERASGMEAELNGRPLSWLDFTASLAVQRAVNSGHDYPLPNSPGQIGKLRLSVPLFTNRLSLGSGMRYLGSRQTLAGATVPALFLSDLTISSTRLTPNLDFQTGVRNLGNVKHFDPVALYSRFDTMPVPGRSLFLALAWHISQ